MMKATSTESSRLKFLRFQLTAFTATAVDFMVTILLREGAGLYYVIAVGFGALAGGVTAFMLNRRWVFKAFGHHPAKQAVRYMLVSGGSVVLNTAGTYFVTEVFTGQYLISKILVSLLIGFTYSYYFSKRFVFYA